LYYASFSSVRLSKIADLPTASHSDRWFIVIILSLMQNGQNGQANGFQKHRVFVDEEQTKNCLTNLQINRCFYLID
jgi:hypothetical protein